MRELIAALDLDSIPQVSLGTGALLIFAACAVLAVLRGIFRIAFGSLALCVSGFVAYFAWRHLPAFSDGLPWLSIGVPVAAGVLTLLVLRKLMRIVTRPAGDDSSSGIRRSPLRWLVTLLFSLVPASALLFSGATALRNIGSVAEIRRFVDGSGGATDHTAFFAALKTSIEKVLPEDWFQGIDPLSEDARVTLAKLIALGDSGPPPKAIPVMEEPELRDLIVNDPELRKLAKAKRYADILRDPRLDRVMENPDLKRVLGDLRL